jgi:hypothetical protein
MEGGLHDLHTSFYALPPSVHPSQFLVSISHPIESAVPSSFHGGYTDGNIPQYREGGHNSFENPNNFVPPPQRNPDQILPDKSSLLPLPPAIKKKKKKNKK